jgi:hypothetical protein
MNKNNDKFKMDNDFYKNKIENIEGLKVWLGDNIQEVVDTNLATGKIHELKWLLVDEKDPQRTLILSQEASTFINRAINGRTSITQIEKDVINKCFVDKYMMKNDVRQIDQLILSPTDKDVNKCNIIAENDLIKPLITEDNINTDMSNMIFNVIDLGNLDMYLICVLGVGIIAVFYLLNKLLNSDEGFSIVSKSSQTLYNESTTKGGLVYKAGYDCDYCFCGGSYRCSGHHLPSEEQKAAWKKQEDEWEEAEKKALWEAAKRRAEAEEAAEKKALEEAAKKKSEAETEAAKKKSDVPLAWGLYFQDGASPSFEGIVDLHNRIMFYLVVILFGVTWVMLSIMRNFNKSENKLVYRYLNHGTLIELIWTVGPALVLVAIAFPSFKLLYLMDEVIDPAMTVKVTGFYEKFYSPIIKFDLKFGGLKLNIICKNKNVKLYKLFNRQLSCLLNNFHTSAIKAGKRVGPHDSDVISVIVGSLLGDCYGSKRYVEGTRFVYKQSIIHKEYLYWLYNFFFSRGYCSNLQPRLYIRKLIKNKEIKEYYGYEFNTFTFRSFDWLHKMFYKEGKKVVNSNIRNYLTPLALAIWISDDECWVKSGVRLASNSFTLKEVELLKEILLGNFGLICTIQKIGIPNQYSIYVTSLSIPKLQKIVSPYIHSSMLYKIGL